MEAFFTTRLPDYLCPNHYLPELKGVEQESLLHASFVNAIIIAFDLMRAL